MYNLNKSQVDRMQIILVQLLYSSIGEDKFKLQGVSFEPIGQSNVSNIILTFVSISGSVISIYTIFEGGNYEREGFSNFK